MYWSFFVLVFVRSSFRVLSRISWLINQLSVSELFVFIRAIRCFSLRVEMSVKEFFAFVFAFVFVLVFVRSSFRVLSRIPWLNQSFECK